VARTRAERSGDHPSVDAIHRLAFETGLEAAIVETLRQAVEPLISIVAELDRGEVVGHIMFSPVTIDRRGGDIEFMGLAPMAVHPRYQNQGIGSRLVEEGLAACRTAGTELVFVLGHPAFYPRFGFLPAVDSSFHYVDSRLDDYFFVQCVSAEGASVDSGTVAYHETFDIDGV